MNDSVPETFAGGDTRALVSTFQERISTIRSRVRTVIVGQDEVVDHLLLTLLVGGHCLITGMPGTAKTLLVRTLATALGLSFKRIQFTPDLMPTDVTGTDIIEEDITTGHRKLDVRARSAVRACRARRRNQSHAAEDASRAARSHAGTLGHGARHDAQIDAAVLRARDAEPDRARRHLSAARSAARSLSRSTCCSTT